jgi:hypothetical protein
MKLFGRANAEERPGNAVTPKQRVEIKIRGVGRTSGNVKKVEDQSVVIELVVNVAADAASLAESDAVLEYTALRGLYRQKGVARFDVNGAGSVRFVGQEEPELVQRRDFVRVDVNIPVTVTLKDNPWPIEFDALNLSGNGALLSPPQGGVGRLRIGLFAWLRIPLYDGKDPIEVRGTVVREAGRGAMGIRFDHINEGDQERLVRYLAREERQQRTRSG